MVQIFVQTVPHLLYWKCTSVNIDDFHIRHSHPPGTRIVLCKSGWRIPCDCTSVGWLCKSGWRIPCDCTSVSWLCKSGWRIPCDSPPKSWSWFRNPCLGHKVQLIVLSVVVILKRVPFVLVDYFSIWYVSLILFFDSFVCSSRNFLLSNRFTQWWFHHQ